VNASAVGRAVEIQTYADRVVIRQDGRVVAEHPRKFGRGETAYDPWHYVPVLARKPGALRNGAPFKDWVLPAALDRVRRKLAGSNDGDRQMVKILAAVLSDGLSEIDAIPPGENGVFFLARLDRFSNAWGGRCRAVRSTCQLSASFSFSSHSRFLRTGLAKRPSCAKGRTRSKELMGPLSRQDGARAIISYAS